MRLVGLGGAEQGAHALLRGRLAVLLLGGGAGVFDAALQALLLGDAELGGQEFFAGNSEAWLSRCDYQEAGPHLLLMAFLQRVVKEGVAQLSGYPDRLGLAEGHLVVFDRRRGARRGDKIFIEERGGPRGQRVYVFGM